MDWKGKRELKMKEKGKWKGERECKGMGEMD